MDMLLHRVLLCLMVFVYSILGLVHSCHSATNLALGKPYTISPAPNYPFSAPPTDKTSLTDGKYTSGYFWTEKTTVGWQATKRVEILIDLQEASVIGGISFDTARRAEVGVFYPEHIAAFVGVDKEHMHYVGDIADDPDNKPGSYRTKKFLLNGVDGKGRYVLLEIITTKGRSIFCDEIEVLEGRHSKYQTGSMSIEAARTFSENIGKLDIEREILNGLADKLQSVVASNPAIADQYLKIRKRIGSLAAVEDSKVIFSDMLSLRGEALRARFPDRKFLIEAISPWGTVSPVSLPTGIMPKDIAITAPQGGYGYGALMITNLDTTAQRVSLSLAKLKEASAELSLYSALFVRSASMEYVPDPLVSGKDFVLQPGESRVVCISARGDKAGIWSSPLNIITGGVPTSIAVECRISKVTLPRKQTLSAVNWGYLNRGLISDRRIQAAQDMLAHHTNAFVVPSDYLPGANQAKTMSLTDSLRLESYLKYFQGADKVLFGIALGAANWSTVVGKEPFLSSAWQAGFKKWYAGAVLAADRAGFKKDQLYIFPYDEMDRQQIGDFIRFSEWARKAIPGIKFYATLNNRQSLVVLPYLDIAQVGDTEDLLKSIGNETSKIWLYDCKGPGKSLSPYTYYRMMPWKAFLHGYSGVGFWAYADTGSGGEGVSAWDDFARGSPGFAVIYEGKGDSIISSRRWEAWRMGIEDYELLTLYAKAKGEKAAKELAATVFQHQEDTTKADEARRKILIELSAINN